MRLQQLSPMMWQGDMEAAKSVVGPQSSEWQKLGIKAVICPGARERLVKHGIEYHNELDILLVGWPDHRVVEPKEMHAVVVFHRTFGSPTFVHCMGGTNRSCAIAASILIEDGLTLEQAFAKVKPWHEQMVKNVEAYAKWLQESSR